MKVKVFDSRNVNDFEEMVNEFIKDKEVFDIKQTTFTLPRQFDRQSGAPTMIDVYTRAIVMYEDVKKE